jgi:hypothetical protein
MCITSMVYRIPCQGLGNCQTALSFRLVNGQQQSPPAHATTTIEDRDMRYTQEGLFKARVPTIPLAVCVWDTTL